MSSKLSTWKNLEEPAPADTQRSNPIQRGYERENARGAAAGASRVACSPQQLQRPFHPSKRDHVQPTAHSSHLPGARAAARAPCTGSLRLRFLGVARHRSNFSVCLEPKRGEAEAVTEGPDAISKNIQKRKLGVGVDVYVLGTIAGDTLVSHTRAAGSERASGRAGGRVRDVTPQGKILALQRKRLIHASSDVARGDGERKKQRCWDVHEAAPVLLSSSSFGETQMQMAARAIAVCVWASRWLGNWAAADFRRWQA